MITLIVVVALFVIATMFIWSLCIVSGRCSREEELRALLDECRKERGAAGIGFAMALGGFALFLASLLTAPVVVYTSTPHVCGMLTGIAVVLVGFYAECAA